MLDSYNEVLLLHAPTGFVACNLLESFTLGYAGMNDNPTYASESTAAILMMVFQYIEEGGMEELFASDFIV